jgi:chemotaxis signal transduction protein
MDTHSPYAVEDLLAGDEPAASVPHATAYLLEYRKNRFVAFPAHTGVELIDQPKVVIVPGQPGFCLGLMSWQGGRRIPLIDLEKLLTDGGGQGSTSIGHVLVLAYQSAPNQALQYGAVLAPSLIRMIEVTDSQQWALPVEIEALPRISLSCFEYQGQAVPILDTAGLFSRSDS